MKRILPILLLLLMTLALTLTLSACGGGTETPSDTSADTGAAASDTAPCEYYEDFFVDAEQPVYDPVFAAGGTDATRFDLVADLEDVPAGSHTLYAVYQLEDGTEVWFFSIEFVKE